MEWNWTVVSGETFTVCGSGYAAITFSSKQLGVRGSHNNLSTAAPNADGSMD
jgi:hypothetical protein